MFDLHCTCIMFYNFILQPGVNGCPRNRDKSCHRPSSKLLAGISHHFHPGTTSHALQMQHNQSIVLVSLIPQTDCLQAIDFKRSSYFAWRRLQGAGCWPLSISFIWFWFWHFLNMSIYSFNILSVLVTFNVYKQSALVHIHFVIHVQATLFISKSKGPDKLLRVIRSLR